jgi:hypothetical protein
VTGGDSKIARGAAALIRENGWVADAAGCRLASAQRLREARAAWGWSQNDLAAEVDKIRAARGLKASDPESLRRQIIAFEKGRTPGPLWRSLLADALQDDEDRLFGLVVDASLPRPLLVHTPLNSDVLDVILAQRAAHIRAEHLFGPNYARDLVDRDLTTIEELISSRRPSCVTKFAVRPAGSPNWAAGSPRTAETRSKPNS